MKEREAEQCDWGKERERKVVNSGVSTYEAVVVVDVEYKRAIVGSLPPPSHRCWQSSQGDIPPEERVAGGRLMVASSYNSSSAFDKGIPRID